MLDNGGRCSDTAAVVMERARRSAKKEESFSHGSRTFNAEWNHILSSQCRHEPGESTDDEGVCDVCLFEKELSGLPQLPEMIFPRNNLTIKWKGHPNAEFSFNALDALKMVEQNKGPGFEVAPSAVWQESRAHFPEFKKFPRPFDWTFTTEYSGTAKGLRALVTDERVDLELLRRKDPILFYAQVPLYEDELADHGCAQLNVRIRVMPTSFFVLQRFYMRVDHVLVRVCDTRVYASHDDPSILVEWTLRESPLSALSHLPPEVINDENQIWMELGITRAKSIRYTPE